MAITNPTNVAAATGVNLANLSDYDSGATVLTSGRWYTMVVHGYATTAADVLTVTHDPVGTPLSFTLVTDGSTSASKVSWDAAAHRNVSVWAVKPSSTTASALIRMHWGSSRSAAGWSLTEWSAGVDPTTFAQKVVINSGTAGTSASVTMSAFNDTNNATFLVVALGTGTADPAENITPTEGRSELTEQDDGERAQHADHYQNPNAGDTSLTATWTNAEDWAGIGIEVKAASAGGGALFPVGMQDPNQNTLLRM